uniref:Uncharacterized protein n=1 Tax=Opuntia streptacantha TaxID=393608 RepID=A0A7C9CXN4_OPUST
MDKATLLAEVISQVKLLKKQAAEATKGLVIPTDADEVTVEPCNDHDVPFGFASFRASLCCHYKPELILEIRKGLEAYKLTIAKPEISTLGSRVKSVFIVIARKEQIGDGKRERFARSIRDALFSILKKSSASEELLPGETFLSKRRKVAFFGDSSSSS